jgi:acyl dehydratase
MTDTTPATAGNAELAAATSAEFDASDLEKDRAIVGRDWAARSQEHFAIATPEGIRNFAASYGDDNPLFTDPVYGRGTRWGGQIAPPIMAAILNAPLEGDRPGAHERGGSYRGIHAFVSGGTWDWYRPIRPGDTLYSFGGLESIEEKKSEFAGRSVVKVNRKVKMNQDAEVVGVCRTLIIYTERRKAKERGKYASIDPPRYTDEELGKIDEIYAAERPRGGVPRYFEDVEVGETLPRMVKGPLTTTDIIVFHAGGYGFVPYGLKTGRNGYRNRRRIPAFYVKNEYGVPDVAQRVHWDPAWSQAIGNPRPHDYGVLRECWVHHYLTDWVGDDGWVMRQHDEIRKFNYQGDTQFLSGEVIDKYELDGRTLVEISFRATNQRGEDTIRGTGTVSLPSRRMGPVLLPEVPADLQRRAIEMMSRHGELLREAKR